MRTIKCVVVGDGYSGKTSLLMRYVNKQPSEDYAPTVFDNYSKNILIESETVELELWDTGGIDDYERLRLMAYPKTDVFIICVSIDDPESLARVKSKWFPEIRQQCPKSPIVVVGTKLDLRGDTATIEKLKASKKRPIFYAEGLAISKEINAAKYIECSARNDTSIETVFEAAAQCALSRLKNA